MKLIIDIPDYEYRQIKEVYEKNDIVENTYGYIYHGTPLDDVKAENKGEWIFDERLDRHYYCSECKSMGVDYWDYCPYCGARMKGGE